MLSQFQWEVVGRCKHCGGAILYNEDLARTVFNPADLDCICEKEANE